VGGADLHAHPRRHRGRSGVEIAGDHLRIEYTRAALASMQEAIGDAIDLRGYLHRSLLDNYEWGD
jgi:beta-glucosidase